MGRFAFFLQGSFQKAQGEQLLLKDMRLGYRKVPGIPSPPSWFVPQALEQYIYILLNLCSFPCIGIKIMYRPYQNQTIYVQVGNVSAAVVLSPPSRSYKVKGCQLNQRRTLGIQPAHSKSDWVQMKTTQSSSVWVLSNLRPNTSTNCGSTVNGEACCATVGNVSLGNAS